MDFWRSVNVYKYDDGIYVSHHVLSSCKTTRTARFWWKPRSKREKYRPTGGNFLAYSLCIYVYMCIGLLLSVAWKLLRFNRTKIYGQVWCDVIEFKFEFNANIVTKCVHTGTDTLTHTKVKASTRCFLYEQKST